MERTPRPYVQIAIDGVDTIIYDPESVHDADLYDRFATFEQARDAALCCIEYALEEGDYEGEGHKSRMESMHWLLESATMFDDLEAQSEYRRLLSRLVPFLPIAA